MAQEVMMTMPCESRLLPGFRGSINPVLRIYLGPFFFDGPEGPGGWFWRYHWSRSAVPQRPPAIVRSRWSLRWRGSLRGSR